MRVTGNFFFVSVSVLLMIVMSDAIAESGTSITLSGEVKASPCIVDTASQTIPLGTYFVSTMAAQGEYVKFSVTLSECPTGTSYVTATFSGEPDASSPLWYYANTTTTGAATGIHIELATDTTTKKGLGNGKTMKVAVDGDKNAEFKLQARVNKDNSTPTPGVIQTTVNITFEYS